MFQIFLAEPVCGHSDVTIWFIYINFIASVFQEYVDAQLQAHMLQCHS